MLLSNPYIVPITLVVICLIIVAGIYILNATNKTNQNPAQTKHTRDVYTETGVNPLTGNKFTHTHTVDSIEN